MADLALGRIPALHGSPGAAANLGPQIAGLTDRRRVFVMVDAALQTPGHGRAIASGLNDAGFEATLFVPPPGEPKEATIAEALLALRTSGAESVVCVGGGSTMDAGKLVAALADDAGEVAHYRLAATPLPRRALPLVCVPTTAGTGAEATAVSVLTAADGAKYWYWADALKPDLVVHDPVLATGLPAAVTAATGIDALVHAIEAATNLNASPLNDMYAHRAIALVTAWLPAALRDGNDLMARARLLEAATLAGIAIDNAGTAIAHNIGHALGSLAGVPHGRAVAIGMAATLAWNVEGAPEVYGPVAAAMRLAGADALPAGFLAFVRDAGVDLSVPDVAAADLARQMAQPENAAMLRANRRPSREEDLLHHAEAALSLAG
jgi:alcohol dehydrogenase class IV